MSPAGTLERTDRVRKPARPHEHVQSAAPGRGRVPPDSREHTERQHRFFPHPRHHRPHRSRLAVLAWFVLVGALVGWWVALAPTAIGGPASYVVVLGDSMQPLLADGDLAIAQRRPSYGAGDLVVFAVDRGQVIHRIVGGSPEQGWTTQGDNNWWLDPWDVHDEDIVGQYAWRVPGAGSGLLHLLRYPLVFGLLAGACVALTYLPHRRHHVSPALAAAMKDARREPTRGGRSSSEYLAMVLLLIATTAAYVVTLVAAMAGVWTPATMATAGCLAMCGIALGLLLYRMYDGMGLDPPTAARNALSRRLYKVHSWPEICPWPTVTRGPVALRSVAEKFRLPVLLWIDPCNGAEVYVVITAHHGCFMWSPHGHHPAEHCACAEKSARPGREG